jgi:transposase
LHREYAYAKRGEKIAGYIPGKKYRRVGIVAAQIGKKVLAPLQYEGTMDGKLFEFWFENCLLKVLSLNSVIVMDNASFHRKKHLTSIADNFGCKVVFLPPYSPEFNPIEKFWALLKQKLKSILRSFRSFDDCLCYCFNNI